jgi:hypothetical protein
MNLLDLSLPSRTEVLKFEALISATDWPDADKNALMGLLKALDAAREALVDGEIAKKKLQAVIAGASDSSRSADIKALFDDGIVELEGSTAVPPENEGSADSTPTRRGRTNPESGPTPKRTGKGHGRKPLLHLVGKTDHHDEVSDRIGEPCTHCGSKMCRGHARQTTIVTASTLLSVHLHVREALECKTCGHEEVTPLPEEVSRGLIGRYAPSAIALLAYLRYFSGFASHRFERASGFLGLEVSETTQWDLFESAADRLVPLTRHLKSIASAAQVITMDHTGCKVVAEQRHRRLLEGESERVGMATSAFLIELAEPTHKFALFHTGPIDAGQYLQRLLEPRPPGSGKLIVACDALASNQKQDHPDVVLALCNVHARRAFLDLGKHAPKAVADILRQYDLVFRTERRAKGLSPEARLDLHQTHSEPAMRRIRDLALSEMLAESRLPGGRIALPFAYVLRHFERLLTFCRLPRAPVHTNEVERALKKPILHRKNSLFFQTFAGSGVADLFTSLFFSAELAGHNPIAFVREALENWSTLARAPESFVPWLVPQLK